MAIMIKHFSSEPLEMKRGERDVFFDLLGEELNTVRDEYKGDDDTKTSTRVSGVFASEDDKGKLVSNFPILVDVSTTPRPTQITVYANPSASIPDGLVNKELWIVILKNSKVVAKKKGLFLTA